MTEQKRAIEIATDHEGKAYAIEIDVAALIQKTIRENRAESYD